MTAATLPSYFMLLREAFSTSAAVDDFDLHSESSISIARFSGLMFDQLMASDALIAYIASHAEEIRQELRGLTDIPSPKKDASKA